MRSPGKQQYLFLGDNSRYTFLEWIIKRRHTINYREQEISVQYARDYTIDEDDTGLRLYVPNIPEDIILYFPMSNEDVYDYCSISKIFIFESFPFCKQDTLELVKRLHDEETDTELLTIFMNTPRKTAFSDLGNPEDSLNEAIRLHQLDNYQHITVRDASAVDLLLNWAEPLSQIKMRNLDQILLNLQIAFNKEIEYRWEIEYCPELLTLDAQNNICSFNSVRKYKQPNIWDSYTAAALRHYFPENKSSGLWCISKLYSNTLENFENIWDIAEDSRCLCETLKSEFLRTMNKNRIKSPRPADETAYSKAVMDGLDQKFWDHIKNFIEHTALDLLRQRLKKRYDKTMECIS